MGEGPGDATAPAPDLEKVQAMVDRLAAANLLVGRRTPLRCCTRCRSPRTPAGIRYREEPGSAFLVRFPLRGSTPRTSLLVWVDSPWKLLGTTALLVNPELPYVTARYRRRDSEELVVVSRSAVGRVEKWLPGATLEVLSESSGSAFAGAPYDHPLAHEMPGLGAVERPAGVVHGSPQVTDTGTGTVTLVPCHGAGDAEVARGLDVAGWPVLDPDLTLSRSFAHKYQGLSVAAADSFIRRDLDEGGYLFAELSVRRGVPHCAVCGDPLVWESGHAWCLEPGRLPPERLELFARLLPDEPIPPASETVPWPVSETVVTEEHHAPILLECDGCDRLAPRSANPACACGGRRAPVRRRLLPVLRDTFDAWVQNGPLQPGEALRLYVADRRRVPAVVHHLIALEAADAHPGEVHLSVFPTLPADEAVLEAEADQPLDAIRASLVGLDRTPRAGPVAVADRRTREAQRLRRAWLVVQETVTALAQDGFPAGRPPPLPPLADLLPEDRAFLSLAEHLRTDALRLYEAGELAKAQRRISGFFEADFREGYLPVARSRLDLSGREPGKLAVYAVLGHVLPLWAELYAPIAPLFAEAVHRALRGDTASVFERAPTPPVAGAFDPALERAYFRWLSLRRALLAARRRLGLPPDAGLGKVVVDLTDEAEATSLRGAVDALCRLTGASVLEITSPSAPWEGLRVSARPNAPEIQKVFGPDSGRVSHLLSELSGRRVEEGLRTGALQVAIGGEPRRITPAMVEVLESIPESVLPVPWEFGELFVEVPAGARLEAPEALPPLSPDAHRLVQRVQRRLGGSAGSRPPEGVVVYAQGRLAEELGRHQTALSRLLGGGRLRLVSSPEGFPAAETVVGRSGRGDRWMVWVPSAAPPNRRRKLRVRLTSVLPSPPEGPEATELGGGDPLAPAVAQREENVHDWVRRLDLALGRPLIGPAKLRYAWEMGFHSYEELTHASFDQLRQVPGFGPLVAAEIVRRFGGSPPPSRSWAARRPPLPPPSEHRASLALSTHPDSGGAAALPGPVAEPAADGDDPTDGGVPTADVRDGGGASGGGLPRNPEVPQDSVQSKDPPEPATDRPSPTGPPDALPAVRALAPLPDFDACPIVLAPEPPPGNDRGVPGGAHQNAPLSTPAIPMGPGLSSGSAPATERMDRAAPTATAATSAEVGGPAGSSPTDTPAPAELEGPIPPASEDGEGRMGSIRTTEAGVSGGGGSRSASEPPGPTEPVIPDSRPLSEESTPGAGPTGPGTVGRLSPKPGEPVIGTPPPPAADGGGLAPADAGIGQESSIPPTPIPPETLPALSPTVLPEPPVHPQGERRVGPEGSAEPQPSSGPPPIDVAPAAPPMAAPPPGGIQFLVGPTGDPAWSAFLDATAAGHRGLCISREFPDRVRARLGPREVTVLWLSNAGRDGTIRPTDLDGLTATVTALAEKEGVRSIYVDSVEYLARVNPTDRLVGFLGALDRLSRQGGLRVWVPLNPLLMAPEELDRLVASLAPGKSAE